MSVISDYKSAPFDIFVQPPPASTYNGTATPQGPGYTPTVVSYGGNNTYDTSYDALCGVRWNTNDGRQVVMVRNGATEIAVAAIGSGLLVQARCGHQGALNLRRGLSRETGRLNSPQWPDKTAAGFLPSTR